MGLQKKGNFLMKKQFLILILISFCTNNAMDESEQQDQRLYKQTILNDIKEHHEKKEALQTAIEQSIKTGKKTICISGEEVIGVCNPRTKKVVFTTYFEEEQSVEFKEIESFFNGEVHKEKEQSTRCSIH